MKKISLFFISSKCSNFEQGKPKQISLKAQNSLQEIFDFAFHQSLK